MMADLVKYSSMVGGLLVPNTGEELEGDSYLADDDQSRCWLSAEGLVVDGFKQIILTTILLRVKLERRWGAYNFR